ncbi:MAG: hypothetical protein ACYTAS_22110, partial [Planctomycetota bacterium]
PSAPTARGLPLSGQTQASAREKETAGWLREFGTALPCVRIAGSRRHLGFAIGGNCVILGAFTGSAGLDETSHDWEMPGSRVR